MNQNSELLLHRLTEIAALSPDIRFSQLLANLGFLSEARGGRSLWDIEDDELLEVVDQHLAELAARAGRSLASRGT
jgi:hypothetical protein